MGEEPDDSEAIAEHGVLTVCGSGICPARSRRWAVVHREIVRTSIAQQMYDELDESGRRRYTVAQIAAEFNVRRQTVYRHPDPDRIPAQAAPHGQDSSILPSA